MASIQLSKRLSRFPPYLFAEIDRAKRALRTRHVDFVDLSIGDPDIPAPRKMIERLYKAAKAKENQKYALDQGKLYFRRAIRSWFKKRFAVSLDQQRQSAHPSATHLPQPESCPRRTSKDSCAILAAFLSPSLFLSGLPSVFYGFCHAFKVVALLF